MAALKDEADTGEIGLETEANCRDTDRRRGTVSKKHTHTKP